MCDFLAMFSIRYHFSFAFTSLEDRWPASSKSATLSARKAYLLESGVRETFSGRRKKLFYISPFTELTEDLNFAVALPGERLRIKIDTLNSNCQPIAGAESETVVASSLTGRRVELNDLNLARLTVQFPFAPLRVIALIHYHALMLWLKRTPFHQKDERIELQQSVMRPHGSLTRANKRKRLI